MKKPSINLPQPLIGLLFALSYAGFVVFLSWLFYQSINFPRPFGSAHEKLNNAIYDFTQRRITVDAKNDWLYDKYRAYFEDIVIFDMNEEVIDKNTGTIMRPKLTAFIHAIKKFDFKAIYIDYEYILKGDSLEIQNLNAALDEIADRLVLPIKVKKIDIEIVMDSLLYKPKHIGWRNNYRRPKGENTIRYFKTQFEDLHYFIPYELVKITEGQRKAESMLSAIENGTLEINYVLRNNARHGNAVPIGNVHTVIQKGISHTDNHSWKPSGKVIFVGTGIEKEVKDKYGVSIHTYNTPVKSKLPLIYAQINAYINFISGGFIHSFKWWHIFALNFIIGGLVWVFCSKKRQKYSNIYTIILNLAGSIAVCIFVATIFLLFCIKPPLLVSLLCYQKSGNLFSFFTTFFNYKTISS